MHISALEKKVNCCGCSACAHLCPKNCITMQEDEEGFLYPKVNESSCVDCELCVKTCPLAKEKYKVTANHLAVPLA